MVDRCLSGRCSCLTARRSTIQVSSCRWSFCMESFSLFLAKNLPVHTGHFSSPSPGHDPPLTLTPVVHLGGTVNPILPGTVAANSNFQTERPSVNTGDRTVNLLAVRPGKPLPRCAPRRQSTLHLVSVSAYGSDELLSRSFFSLTTLISAWMSRSSSTCAIFSCSSRSISCLYSLRCFSSDSRASNSIFKRDFIFCIWMVLFLQTTTTTAAAAVRLFLQH